MGRKKGKDHGRGNRAYERDGPDRRDEWPGDELPVLRGHGGGAMTRVESPKEPPPDPVKVAAALAAITKVEIGMPESFSHPITYSVVGNGIFRIQTTALGMMIAKVEGLPTVNTKLTSGFYLGIPKIPFQIVAQVYGFFRDVCKKAKKPSEAYAQVWYSRSGNLFFIQVPEQDVSGASVHHKGRSNPTEDLIHVADIHSHGSMSAFFSGTDDADEKTQGVRIFGVIGNIMDKRPSMKWRIGKGDGTFLDVSVKDVVEVETSTVDIKVSLAQLLSDGTFTMKDYSPWPETETPKDWLDKVETESRVVTTNSSHVHAVGSFHSQGTWKPGGDGPSTFFTRDGVSVERKEGMEGRIWENEAGRGWRLIHDPKAGGGKTDTTKSSGTEVAHAPKSFHTSIGTFLVEKDHLTHIPMVGDSIVNPAHGMGGVRD